MKGNKYEGFLAMVYTRNFLSLIPSLLLFGLLPPI